MFLAVSVMPDKALAFSEPDSAAFFFNQNITPQVGELQVGAVVPVIATAYSSTPDQTDGSPYRTASGTLVRPGVIAANFLPLGTKVRLNGTLHVVEDRMNSRYNNAWRVDIWMFSREAAIDFGSQNMLLKVVDLPD